MSLPGNGNLVPLEAGTERTRRISAAGGAAFKAKRERIAETESELRARIVNPATVEAAWRYYHECLTGKRKPEPAMNAVACDVLAHGIDKPKARVEQVGTESTADFVELVKRGIREAYAEVTEDAAREAADTTPPRVTEGQQLPALPSPADADVSEEVSG